MSELGQGLTLSGLGILITFSALGMLIGLILLLKALFPLREEKTQAEVILDSSSPSLPNDREELRKRAAGVGVGILMKERNRSRGGSLGKLLEEPPAGWWRKGVDRVQGKE